MDDLLRQLVGYARGIWTYRWWGLLTAWIVGLGGAVGVYLLPDKYEASARIYVDTQSVLAPLMRGLAVPADVNQQVAMLSKTLISRPNVEKLIRMADLDLAAQSKTQREELITDVTNRLKIGAAGRDNLYTLAFLDEKPERAKRVVQSFVSMFVESGLGDKRKDTDAARRFIEEQIKNYAQKLDEAEARVKEFKLKNLVLMGDSGKDSIGQLSQLNAQLAQARLELREAENSRDAIKRQIEGEDPMQSDSQGGADTAGAVPELDGRIDALKRQLDELLRRYTENHPDVKGTRSVLASLEKQREEEISARRAKAPTGVSGAASANPVYQQLRVSLTEAEATIASLRTRVAEFEARANQARNLIKMGPQLEQEFAQLNRDYEINKRNYDELVSRRESANISVEMDSSSGMAEFRLIDPPNVPTKPSAPNRSVLMPAVGVGALLLGMALALLLSQLRPTFYDGRALREVSGLPILGSISLLSNPANQRKERRRGIFFAGGLAAYGGLFAGLTLIVMLFGRPF